MNTTTTTKSTNSWVISTGRGSSRGASVDNRIIFVETTILYTDDPALSVDIQSLPVDVSIFPENTHSPREDKAKLSEDKMDEMSWLLLTRKAVTTLTTLPPDTINHDHCLLCNTPTLRPSDTGGSLQTPTANCTATGSTSRHASPEAVVMWGSEPGGGEGWGR